MVVVDQCYFDDCQILQSFVLGEREAIRFHGFGWPLTFRKTTTFKRVAEIDVTLMIVRFYRVLF
jgi:hypothetical protein